MHLSISLLHAVPGPEYVSVTSNPASPVMVDSNVSITCTVKLSPEIDSTVAVNTQMTDPAGSNTVTDPISSGSSSIYAATMMISSFGRNESGNYICAANVRSMSPFLIDSDSEATTEIITVGNWLNFLCQCYKYESRISCCRHVPVVFYMKTGADPN